MPNVLLDSFLWIEDLLPDGFQRKPMFGGRGYYIDSKLVLVVFASPGDRKYKQQVFDYDIWNGCMLPAERENHPEVLKQYSFLIPHPVLNKWLYIPLDTENFEENVTICLKEIKKKSALFGTYPLKKTKNKISKSRLQKIAESQNLKFSKNPSIFSETQPLEEYFKKMKRISDFKNLGPTTEKHFAAAGIKTPQAFIKLGWQTTLKKLVKVNSKNRHSLFAMALIGALENKDWHQLDPKTKEAAKAFTQSLKPLKKKK